MKPSFRTESGGSIDRSKQLVFTFNDQRYTGCVGDTLASALLANGVHLTARSFKYHRPRGIVSAGPEEPCAMVRVGEGARVRPNVPATMVELYDGLIAASINCWPGVNFDLMAVNNAISAILPAGFYYKTFMWPTKAWMHYERFIRKAAGLGVTPAAPDPDRYDKRNEHCDVLVIGGGPSGIAAALAAGETGARVLLVEERAQLGGQLLFRDESIGNLSGRDWLAQTEAALEQHAEVRIVCRATATGYYDHNLVTLVERVSDHLAAPLAHLPRQRLWKVRAKQVIVATGAIERPMVFGNNDLPGVMLAAAAQRYSAQYAVRPGTRAMVFTNNDSGYEAAIALAKVGVEVAALIDPRSRRTGADALQTHGITVMPNHVVVAAAGRKHVQRVTVAPVDAKGDISNGSSREIACDLLCVSGGWDPAVHLYSQSGGKLAFDDEQHCFVPGAAVQPTVAVGAANGAFFSADCIVQGRVVGLAATRGSATTSIAPAASAKRALDVRPLWVVPGAKRGTKSFVDLQSDVTTTDLALAVREGYVAVEHAKRYTTTGMGVDQGKTGNIIAYGILSGLTGRTIPEIGTTTFRPPYTPVTMGALAGRDIGARFEPLRNTPISEWHTKAGAVFEPVGLWRRPLYYPKAGEDMQPAVARECLAVRNGVGLLDASTLGKFEIHGPDAVKLLNRVYTNAWDNLAVGRCRYGLMLREDGMVFDDGVTARLGDTHYLMSTTSGGADGVIHWLEDWLQCEWRDLKVFVTPVTAHWATVCVTGPRARDLLMTLPSDIDFSAAAFPHMSLRIGTIAGVLARIARVSFTGELSYEINVPARYGLALWQALLDTSPAFEVTPFGTEALHVLRAEKGYIVVGHETDGTVTPLDLGMAGIVNLKKGDFLGKRGLMRADNIRTARKELVGLLTIDPAVVVPEGSQIIAMENVARISQPPVPMLGHVTSSYASPALERSIAMALLANGRQLAGTEIAVIVHGRAVPARVADTCFYDREGARLNG